MSDPGSLVGPTRILVIGYGSIGRRHVEVLRQLSSKATLNIVSGHLDRDAGVFPSLDLVPGLEQYDYFVIASPTNQHQRELRFLDSRVVGKRILVEKPIFEFIETDFVPRNDVFVGYNLRYHPVVIRMKELLARRKVLNLGVYAGQYLPGWRPDTDYRNSYSASKERGGGVLRDLSHEIDYVQWLVGDVVDAVGVSRKISKLEINSDDFSSFLGKTSTGCYINVTLDYLAFAPRRALVANAENALFEGDLIEGLLRQTTADGNAILHCNQKVERNYTYREMHKDILLSKDPIACRFNEGLSVLNCISMIESTEREILR